jgi:hypothetical protein
MQACQEYTVLLLIAGEFHLLLVCFAIVIFVVAVCSSSSQDHMLSYAICQDFASKRNAIGDCTIPLEPTDLLAIFDNKEMTKNYNRFSQTECKKDGDVCDAWKCLHC